MERKNIPRLVFYFVLAGALFGICLFPAFGQTPTQAVPATAATTTYAPGQMEALAAPIALYPDQLLAKVLIASTYPMEVVEAARWRQQNKNLSGSALDSALASQTWDDSVKQLTYTPEVLDMMDKQLDWTQKLGDAVLTDQAGMLKAVQRLRVKAQANGKLTDTTQQHVVTENQTIVIQPAEPEKVYVPYYDSSSVYGPWDYGYPAYGWPPPYGYAYGAGLGFVTGAIIGAAFWNNNCNWGGGSLTVNNFNNFNNINNIRGGQNWQHNVNHRRGAAYGNQGLRDRYGRGQMAGADGRRDFRGFDNNGLGNNGLGNRGGIGDRNGIGNRGGLGDRGGLANNGGLGGRDGLGGNNGLGNRGGLGGNSGLGGGSFGGNRSGISNTSFNRGGGFDGLGRGSQTRSFSNRGGSSLGSARSSGFRGGGGGGFRGGGGGMRGGGGRRR
ncbi:MAG TPA: DUF3300 domain-containing protein [Rhizomicrobium sp.]|nr:DUF3300 domain-containing protein [Rhizomicrobium sp.]